MCEDLTIRRSSYEVEFYLLNGDIEIEISEDGAKGICIILSNKEREDLIKLLGTSDE